MKIDGNHIIADEGKILQRIASGEIVGSELYLGYSHYIGGVRQDPPHLDVPEDFTEVDDPAEIPAEEALRIITGEKTDALSERVTQ